MEYPPEGTWLLLRKQGSRALRIFCAPSEYCFVWGDSSGPSLHLHPGPDRYGWLWTPIPEIPEEEGELTDD